MRGSGDSEGLLTDEYARIEQDDALEVIAWLAAQPWCSGAVGMFGNNGSLENREDGTSAARFHDFGVDGSYQFLGTREHVVAVNGSYLRERDSVAHDSVSEGKLNASYHFRNTWGGSVGLFNATSHSGDNDNSGYILQADWTPWGKEDSWKAPWANVRLGLQYVGFNKVHDEAGVGEKASDSNSLHFFVWTAF